MMKNEIIIFNNNFNIKNNNSILNYIYSNIEFQNKTDLESFIFSFTELYKLPILVSLLNSIITKLKHKQANFKLIPLKTWDRVLGHCKTVTKEIKAQESVFKQKLFNKYYTIVIKQNTSDIIIHEIGHAIESISNIDINKEFKANLDKDLHINNSNSIQLKAAVVDVMQKQLKGYELKNITSELFARFFELLAMSEEVGGWGKYQFNYTEISNYFKNTIIWTKNILIPILHKKIDQDIETDSIKFIENLKPYKKEWFRNNYSKFENVENMNNKWVETILGDEKHSIKPENVMDVFNKQESKTLNGVEYIEFGKKKQN